MTDTAPVIHPKFHHVNLKTTRLQEMIDFYGTLVGAEVVFQFDGGAWLSNDAANHRIALLAFPNFVDDPEKDTRTGMHHSAFEYANFEELNSSYLQPQGRGDHPGPVPRPRDDAVLLLRRSAWQPRRAAGRLLGDWDSPRPGWGTRRSSGQTRSVCSSTPSKSRSTMRPG